VNREENIKLFMEKAEAVSAEVHRVASISEAKKKFLEIVKTLSPKQIVAVNGELVKKIDLPTAAKKVGAKLFTKQLRFYAPEADLGVSEMELGIAETGSVAQDATDMGKRLVSTLPPVHLAFLHAKTIVPTLRDAIAKAGEKGGPAPYWAIITGPSRTADIERVLTIGVHGPSRLIIILLDETSNATAGRGGNCGRQ